MYTFPIEDFSGGWNPRDAWSKIADNECPDMLNMTLDERGGLTKRLGLTKYNSSQLGADALENIFYSAALGLLIAQQGTQIYKSTPGSGTWSSFATMTTSERVCFVDFLGKLVVGHPTDKMFTYDGTTWTGPVANSPKASTMAVWQNAIWSAGDSANPSRVTRSDLGAITWPASPVTNDLRQVNDKAITAIGGGTGMDTQGRAGLLVFKEDSIYRIHDSSNGAYVTLDVDYGAGGSLAVATNQGVTCAISRKGIVQVIGEVPQLISSKIEPVFHDSQMNMSKLSNMVCGSYRDRLIFSLARSGSTANNLTLEYSPLHGWIVPHSFGLSCATSVLKTGASTFAEKLYGGAASSGYAYDVFTGGSDDGSAISGRFQTRWWEPNRGNQCRFRRLLVNGRGSFSLYFKTNYDTGAGDLHSVAITGSGMVWGSGTWGVDTWGSSLYQDYERLFSLGYGRSFSIEVQESSTTSATGPKLLDDGTAETLGAFSVYGFALDIQRLGQS